jgi:putative heme iron utilization protein
LAIEKHPPSPWDPAIKYGLAMTKGTRPGTASGGTSAERNPPAAARGADPLDAARPPRLIAAVSPTDYPRDPAEAGRRMLRRCGRAALATSLRGAPYASLVIYAVDYDASPLLLLSDLAQHSRNIAFDPRVSLLIDGTAELPEPLSGPRLSLLGQAEVIADRRLRDRFTARYPDSKVYAGFADFKLYRIAVERGQLVSGFGQIAWIEGSDLLFSGDATAIAAAESAIVARVNEHFGEIHAGCIAQRLGLSGQGWRATGVDPEGLDVRSGDAVARLDFAAPVSTADAVAAALARLAGTAGASGEADGGS